MFSLCRLAVFCDNVFQLPSRKEIPEAAVWQVLHDVGQALRHVHATGLVHLDVKPANLLIGDEGINTGVPSVVNCLEEDLLVL